MTRLFNRHELRSPSVKALTDVKNKPQPPVPCSPDQSPGQSPDVFALEEDKKESRLTRRLRSSIRRVRRPVLSRLSRRLEEKQARRRLWQRSMIATAFVLGLGGSLTANLFVHEKITLGGVPYRVIDKFWQDPAARAAYFAADKQQLHSRLQALGVEEDIKDFYRDRFDTEYELDRHIHQIMFDRTGYVGEAYEVNKYGRLISVKYKSVDF